VERELVLILFPELRTGSNSDLSLDPMSEGVAVVVLKNLEVSSIPSSRSGLRRGRYDLLGAQKGDGIIPVASHSPSFPRCLINAPNLTSLEEAFSLKSGRAMHEKLTCYTTHLDSGCHRFPILLMKVGTRCSNIPS